MQLITGVYLINLIIHIWILSPLKISKLYCNSIKLKHIKGQMKYNVAPKSGQKYEIK